MNWHFSVFFFASSLPFLADLVSRRVHSNTHTNTNPHASPGAVGALFFDVFDNASPTWEIKKSTAWRLTKVIILLLLLSVVCHSLKLDQSVHMSAWLGTCAIPLCLHVHVADITEPRYIHPYLEEYPWHMVFFCFFCSSRHCSRISIHTQHLQFCTMSIRRKFI